MLKKYSQILRGELLSFLPKRNSIFLDIPTYTQLNEENIKSKLNDDWSRHACGMACLKMILDYERNEVYPIVELADKCTEYGGFVFENGEIKYGGLVYEPFCSFIKNEFDINAEVASYLSLRRIKSELSNGNYVIVSVHYQIKNLPIENPPYKGGHLILVTGYDKDSFYFNNSSLVNGKPLKNHKVSKSDFKRFFARRGIIIYK